MPRYFQSEWSYAQLRGFEGKEKAICAIDSTEEYISIVSADGLYTHAHFGNGGEAVRVLVGSCLTDPEGVHVSGPSGMTVQLTQPRGVPSVCHDRVVSWQYYCL